MLTKTRVPLELRRRTKVAPIWIIRVQNKFLNKTIFSIISQFDPRAVRANQLFAPWVFLFPHIAGSSTKCRSRHLRVQLSLFRWRKKKRTGTALPPRLKFAQLVISAHCSLFIPQSLPSVPALPSSNIKKGGTACSRDSMEKLQPTIRRVLNLFSRIGVESARFWDDWQYIRPTQSTKTILSLGRQFWSTNSGWESEEDYNDDDGWFYSAGSILVIVVFHKGIYSSLQSRRSGLEGAFKIWLGSYGELVLSFFFFFLFAGVHIF